MRDLVEAEILEVVPASDGSAYQEYILTTKGKELFTIVLGLRQWGEGHLFQKGETCAPMVERNSGRQVPKIALHTCDGKPLKPEDTMIKRKIKAHGKPAA